MHAEAVEFDFVQPLVAVRRLFDELRQLRPDPVRQEDGCWASGCRSRHIRGNALGSIPAAGKRNVRIATYNVNGINGRLPNLLAWLKDRAPDIVCLQELKAPDEKFPAALSAMPVTARCGTGRRPGTV